MKQDDILRLTIRDVGYSGEGIARYGDYTVFVPFALPDEVVEAKVKYVKKQLVYAALVRIVTPSERRVTPPCNRYGKCGGCDLMHAEYAYQLALKRRQIATTLSKAGVEAEVLSPVASPKTLGYRNKISLPFGIVDGRPALGFYREGTHRVVRITRCPLHEAWVETLIDVTLRYVTRHDISIYDSETGKGCLRHLVARKLDDHVDVTLVVNADEAPMWRDYVAALEEVWHDFCLYVSPNLRHNNVIMGDSVRLVWGTPYRHTVDGIVATVNPMSFLQVNDDICAAIYDRVREIVQPTEGSVVIDAFAGVGVLGASLAKAGADVYNIEIVQEAVEDADRIAADNGVVEHNMCGDSAVLLPALLSDLGHKAPTVHDMHLLRPYFDAIAEGRKRYELRLWDDKRRAIATGDLICFTSEDEVLYCRVGVRHVFDDFATLFATLGTEHTCGAAMSTEEAARSMDAIYTPAAQAAHGVVALEMTPVSVTGATVILDPPRKGCPPAVVDALVSLGKQGSAVARARTAPAWERICLPTIERIVYISCNPATLARDLAQLSEAYAIDEVQPYDMFPQTRHVETLVQLSHKTPDSHIVVKVDFDKDNSIQTDTLLKNAQAYKPAERVTYKMIQAYVEEKYGFNVHTAYIAEVKRCLGLPMYDAPNAVEELKRPRQHPSEKMIEAIKDALKHFGIIN